MCFSVFFFFKFTQYRVNWNFGPIIWCFSSKLGKFQFFPIIWEKLLLPTFFLIFKKYCNFNYMYVMPFDSFKGFWGSLFSYIYFLSSVDWIMSANLSSVSLSFVYHLYSFFKLIQVQTFQFHNLYFYCWDSLFTY